LWAVESPSPTLLTEFVDGRTHDKGGVQWIADSEIERTGFYRGFTAIGKNLLNEFAALVRWCERTGLLDRLSEMHPHGWQKRMQTTWGGTWR
jgi:hypothetical protein